MRRFLRTSVSVWLVAAVLCSFDLHLQVLQVAAWARMIVTYSQTDGLAQGVRETFDGQHPCNLCEAIEEARETSSDSISAAPIPLRVDSTAPDVTVALPHRTEKNIAHAPVQDAGESFARPPPVPPPRA